MAGKWKVKYKVLEKEYRNFREQYSCNVTKWIYKNLPKQYMREGELLPREGISIAEEIVYRDRRYQLIEGENLGD